MDLQLTDKVAAVIGGSRGIGKAIALALALDITDASAADRALATLGRIDVLVNNTGYGQLGAFEELSPKAIERQFASNVFGLMHVTRALLPVMRRQRGGHVFNISSMAGHRGGNRCSVYAASKFAVQGFSESLSKELRGGRHPGHGGQARLFQNRFPRPQFNRP